MLHVRSAQTDRLLRIPSLQSRYLNQFCFSYRRDPARRAPARSGFRQHRFVHVGCGPLVGQPAKTSRNDRCRGPKPCRDREFGWHCPYRPCRICVAVVPEHDPFDAAVVRITTTRPYDRRDILPRKGQARDGASGWHDMVARLTRFPPFSDDHNITLIPGRDGGTFCSGAPQPSEIRATACLAGGRKDQVVIGLAVSALPLCQFRRFDRFVRFWTQRPRPARGPAATGDLRCADCRQRAPPTANRRWKTESSSPNHCWQWRGKARTGSSSSGRRPAAICDKNGKPLLSWRVQGLPFIERG